MSSYEILQPIVVKCPILFGTNLKKKRGESFLRQIKSNQMNLQAIIQNHAQKTNTYPKTISTIEFIRLFVTFCVPSNPQMQHK